MSGTNGDIIPIVIIPVILLAYWLIMMFYVNAHPRWPGQAPADTVSTQALEGSVPVQRLASPGPVVPGQRPGPVAGEDTAEQAQASDRPPAR